jgi:hypothetical protein
MSFKTTDAIITRWEVESLSKGVGAAVEQGFDGNSIIEKSLVGC